MSNLNKIAFLIFIGIAPLLSFLLAGSVDTLPTAADIDRLAKAAALTTDTFTQQSFGLRMKYQFNGELLNQHDKENLQELAKTASSRLAEIAETQRRLKQRIEDYAGDDWDAKYGVTGLWRKSAGELYKTIFSKCEIDYYLALTAEQPQRNEVLHKILFQIDSTFSHVLSGDVKLLRIKTLILLAETESKYKIQAKGALNSPDTIRDPAPSTSLRTGLREPPGMSCEFYIREQIQKIKFTGKTKPNQLNKLADYLFESGCSDDIELVLSLAFLQRRSNQPEALRKTVRRWPRIEDYLGSLVLSDISSRIAQQQGLQQISVFEAELAAQAAWRNKARDHQILLERLSGIEKFQTPLILYVAAAVFADTSPTQTTNLLIKASKLQQSQKSDMLNIEPGEIAAQAAQLAYNLFVQNSSHCRTALKAFENYSEIASDKIDEELEYLYTVVLRDCGRGAESKKLLQKIADGPAPIWRSRAKLELIAQQLQQAQYENQSRPAPPLRAAALEQLNDFILSCPGRDKDSNKLRSRAITIYCRTLLKSRPSEGLDRLSAQKVLDILDNAEITGGIRSDLFKSKALQQLGRLEESVHYMVSAITPAGEPHPYLLQGRGEVTELLSEVVDKIDQWESKAGDFNKMVKDCKALAEFSNASVKSRRTALLLAEISTFAADKEKSKLSEAEALLNSMAQNSKDADWLRCRARLLAEQGKFDRAGQLWAQLARIRRTEATTPNQRSWKWWRAKFYELYCWSKCPQTEKENVVGPRSFDFAQDRFAGTLLHTIEVLESSFTDIPPFWAEKLNSLKQQCQPAD